LLRNTNTPVFLIYGAYVILPEEISYASPRVRAYDEDTTEEVLQDSFDRLNEHHGMTLVHSARY
jgi:predicted ATPase